MITYPEGGMPGSVLRQIRQKQKMAGLVDTVRVQLIHIRPVPNAKINSPADVVNLVKELEDADREYAKMLFLDTKNQVIGIETISIGSLSASIVHPREALKGAILSSSASTIFVHNHPSGVCEPSNEDVEISGRLKEAFETVGIALLDSIIVGKGCYYSLKESGFLGEGMGKTSGAMVIKEPNTSQETKGKVDFITTMTDYITAPDLIRRKRAAEKIQAGKYFKPWFDEFFYEHDRESAKRKLMKFFMANEQGLGAVNHSYYGVLTEYLNAISKHVAELTVRENTVPLVQHIKQEIKAIHALATKNDPSASPRADNAMKQIDSGVKAKTITQEQAKTLKEAVGRAFYKFPYIEIAKLLGEKEIVTAEPIVLKTEKLGPFYLSYVQLGKEVYSEWGNSPEEAVRNALAKAEKQVSLHTVSENIQTTNNIDAFLNRLTVETGRYSHVNPIPESLVTGAAIAGDGFLFAYHVTDDPGGIMQKLKSNITLCQLNPEGDLGCGLYVSGVPQYWFVRSREKWEFARQLNRAQRQSLVTVILSDPNYKKGGGYLADFEVDYLTRDLKQFVETGDVNILAGTGNQPYNVHITKEIARKAGVPVPKIPKTIKIKLQGKFINAAGLYSNPEIVNRAQAWAVINRPKLLEWNKRVSTQNIVNAWLCSMGYSGAFTKSGMSTNPEMAIWDRKAIIDARIPEPQT